MVMIPFARLGASVLATRPSPWVGSTAKEDFSADASRCTQSTRMATESRLGLWLNVDNTRPSTKCVTHGL